MKRTLLLPLLAALALGATACQKQQTEAERNAEIERQVQERLNGERSAADRQKMAERQAALEARINALAAAQKKPSTTATAAPNEPASRPASASSSADAETGSYATFYRKLDPYGDWMETGDYGYVFQPRQATQARDWRPYTNGHWVYTDAGWTWISDEKFGWATYHYGRWVRLRSVGWVWVPGEQWAPAWVSWRKGGDYVGWAPLPPEAQFNRQTGIRNWADNYYDIGPEQYAFVPANEFGRKLTQRAIVPTERNVTIINQTINVTNIVYNNSVIVDQGPSYDDLRKQSRQPIERYRLERTQNMPNDVPVFKGEVVALPTVDFRQAERATRPNRVTRTISQTVAERGWAGIQNAQAAQKARAKMEAEATPPPNLPPKRFVRPDRPAVPSEPGPVNAARPGKPTIPTAKATPMGTPVLAQSIPPTVAPTASPRPTPTEAPSPRQGRKGHRPDPTATATPDATATPAEADPTPPVPAENVVSPKQADREAARAAQQEKMKQRAEQQAQRQAERQQKMQERRGQKPGRPEASTPEPPAATATPSATTPAATTTPAASDKMTAAEIRRAKRAEKRAERQGKKGHGKDAQSPTPEETTTPGAQQP